MPDAMRVQLTTKEKADLIDVTQPWHPIGPVKSKALIDWTLRGVCEAYNKAEPIMSAPAGAAAAAAARRARRQATRRRRPTDRHHRSTTVWGKVELQSA